MRNKKRRIGSLINTYGITAESEPIYDEWGYDNSWTCEHWVVYFDELLAAYGLETAVSIWKSKWSQVGFTDWQFRTCTGPNGGWFVNYIYNMSQQQIVLDTSHIILNDWQDTAINTNENVTDTVNNASEGANYASTVAKYAIPTAIAFIVYRFAKKIS
ncbi:MAG: hypothetical protein ACPG5B_06750 [Chitinophagales bacterium]